MVAGLVVVSCAFNPLDVRDSLRALDSFELRSELAAASDPVPDRDRLVVLQHGMLRSARSMWRLENVLTAHGYDVLNVSYPSTSQGVEAHAAQLATAIETELAARRGSAPVAATAPPPELHFIGHSLGGLVIRCYLARPDARPAASALFLGTPQRGAALAGHFRDRWVFQTFGGTSAEQLVPGHDIYARLPRVSAPRIGVLYGARGDAAGWNDRIPGDDDGRVGVAEAQLPEQTAVIEMRLRHTWLAHDDAALVQILHFLRHGTFIARPN
ncbi:MAG: hypothetical protein NXI31_23685 [bacterium]|nr:hypothetical protein [bacterium]